MQPSDAPSREPALRAKLALLEDEVRVGGALLRLLRPSDPVQLLDEEAFAQDEFLPYWAELWPSALALAEALPATLRDARVLEVGCGLGLPSLVAAGRGARVLATDWAEDALQLLLLNASRNQLRLEVAHLDWASPANVLGRTPFDLVLAADVLYERRNVSPLLQLFAALRSEVLLADPGRTAAAAFFEQAELRFALTPEEPGVYRLSPNREA